VRTRANGCDETYMNAHEVLNRLLESQDVWILILLSVLIVVCMVEELLYEHTHPLCLVCIVDGLLYQKLLRRGGVFVHPPVLDWGGVLRRHVRTCGAHAPSLATA
jgi:hypothetical protein